MVTSSAQGIKWNLADLFTAHDDPRIDVTIKHCHTSAAHFAGRFRPLMEKPETLDAETLLQALKELEIIYESLGRVGSYAGLLYAADTADPNFQDLEQSVE
jgi:oligoendopeptidase F